MQPLAARTALRDRSVGPPPFRRHNVVTVTVALLCIAAAIRPTGASRVTFWSDINHNGDAYHIEMRPGQCYRLGLSNDRLSSFATNDQCVDLYTRPDCFGGMFRSEAQSTECHRNLGDCDMNDRVSSVRLCPKCRYSCYGPRSEDGSDDLDEAALALLELTERNTCRCQCNCEGLCMSQNYQY